MKSLVQFNTNNQLKALNKRTSILKQGIDIDIKRRIKRRNY